MIGKLLLHIGKNLIEAKHLRTRVICSKEELGVWAGGSGGGSSATPRKRPRFYFYLSLQIVFSALNMSHNCYIMTIGSSTQGIYPA